MKTVDLVSVSVSVWFISALNFQKYTNCNKICQKMYIRMYAYKGINNKYVLHCIYLKFSMKSCLISIVHLKQYDDSKFAD